MAQLNNIVTVDISLPSLNQNVIHELKKLAKHGKLSIEVVENRSVIGTKYVTVLFKNDNDIVTTEFLEGYYREGCYCFCVGTPAPTYELEIDDTTSLDPKNLTEDDLTLLEITNPHLSKQLLHMYLMIKDLLDNKINVEELVDNMKDYVYSLSK